MTRLQLLITALNKPLRQSVLWLRAVAASYLIIISAPVMASNDAILLMHDGKIELVQEIIQSLSQNLSNTSIRIDVLDATAQPLPNDATLKNYSSLVTLGTQATQIAVERNPPVSILSLLISKKAWLLINQHKSNYTRSAIVLDQPINRQILLMHEIYGRDNHIGVILGPYSAAMQTELLDVARQHKQALSVKTIQSDEELIPVLNHLVEQVDILLAEPDPVVYNKRSIQGILLLTYRNKKPVIGFSQAYSRAGAMVSLYSDAQNLARQTTEIILEKTTGEHIYSPKYFSISYNQQVARALGYILPDESEVINRIHQKEKLP
jgi:putative tryptophan/tyrosine transport system substrate-binding protein